MRTLCTGAPLDRRNSGPEAGGARFATPARMIARAVVDDFLAQKDLAIVGVSRSGEGFGNVIVKELDQKGYTLHLVHPEVDQIGGRACVASLAEVAEKVGGVVLVTPPAQTEKLVGEIADLGIKRVWMQQGAESEAAIRAAEERGLSVVHHHCILMFAEPAHWIHRAHRWMKGVSGGLPT